jgi:hypothetical protein
MKSKNVFDRMLNPFTRIAGWQSLGLGLAFLILMGLIGAYSGVAFDGVLDMHLVKDLSLQNSFIYLAIDVVSLVLIMWIAGLTLSRGFRFVDILGTMTLAKAPFLILAIGGLFTTVPDLSQMVKNPAVVFQSVSFIVLLILSIPVIIWSVALMYHALKVSCGVTGNKLTIVFIIALLLSEAVSKLLVFILA